MARNISDLTRIISKKISQNYYYYCYLFGVIVWVKIIIMIIILDRKWVGIWSSNLAYEYSAASEICEEESAGFFLS